MKRQIALLASIMGVCVSSFGNTHSANSKMNTLISHKILIDTTQNNGLEIKRSFFGADTNGFNPLPAPALVNPLQLDYVKFGGSLHSVYNWKLNLYFDARSGILPVYSPLVDRIQYVQNNYQATPLFQVNMLGLQPDYDAQNVLRMMNTADDAHAARAIQYLNGDRRVALKHILMGNEPFISAEVHGVPSPSADEYIEKYIKYAIALRDAQVSIGGDPSDLKLWGPEIATGWTGWQTTHPTDCRTDYSVPGGMVCSYGNGQFSEFIPYFLYRLSLAEKDTKVNPNGYKLLDYLTWHYYPLFRTDFSDRNSIIRDASGNQNIAGMLESTNLWTSPSYINQYDSASPKRIAPQIVEKFKKWRDTYYPTAKLSVTEFGVDSVNNIEYHPIVRPLYLGDLMARIANAGVDTFFNSFLQGGRSGELWAMINNGMKTHLYFVYSLFSKNYLGKVLVTTDNAGDLINAYSVKTATGVTSIIVNKDTIERWTTVNVMKSTGEIKVTDLKLTPWSVTVIKIPDNGNPLSIERYGAKEMGIPVTP